jgi:EmrB/QacA subfamily drug resistance transporter
VLLATILGSAMAFMDSSVVNVALPTLQTNFRASSSGIQWVVQSYALFGAALLLLGGAVGDHYGRRRAFCWGVALFAVGSAGCGAAFSLSALIAARALQGVGAALLVPQGLSILSASFSGEERGRAIGIWSAWTGVFGAVGPVVGGWLLQVWSWRLIFLLNLPLAAVVLALAPRIPESRGGDSERPLDWLGAALATTSFAALIYGLSFAPELGWRSARVLTSLLAGGLLLAAFLASQTGRPNAMMPLSLFRIRRFLAPNLLTLLLYGALGGALYVIPFYVIQVRHYRPAGAGAVFLPLVAMMFLFSARVGGLVGRVGEQRLLTAGAALSGAGFCALAALANRGSYISGVLPGVLLLGAGLTLAVAPLTTAVMSSVPEGEMGIASAVNNALSRLAGLVAVSLLALVLAHGFRVRLQAELGRSALPERARAAMVAGVARLHETPIPDHLSAEQRTAAIAAVDRAFVAGFRSVMTWCAVSCWVGAVAVWGLLRGHAARAVPPVSAQPIS